MTDSKSCHQPVKYLKFQDVLYLLPAVRICTFIRRGRPIDISLTITETFYKQTGIGQVLEEKKKAILHLDIWTLNPTLIENKLNLNGITNTLPLVTNKKYNPSRALSYQN